jgi:flavin-dependent dehydrogenase
LRSYAIPIFIEVEGWRGTLSPCALTSQIRADSRADARVSRFLAHRAAAILIGMTADSANGAYDVAIIGGGPGGSTTGAMLRRYDPSLKVLIVEREKFPREHIGESMLPPISRVLHEMGAWDKVESAGFVIKLGATYTWGKTTEPWVFGFVPMEEVRDDPRPAPYAGWRTRVAFQVDRAIYDDVLLKHAASLGCEVREASPVEKVLHEGDRVTGLQLASGDVVTARHYVDASGNAAVLRKAMGVKVDAPTRLQNIAFWDYWERPGLNVGTLELAATRIQIRSVPFGWMWFIVLDANRTSVGLVCPAEYYKQSGKRPEELYAEGLRHERGITKLLEGATPTNDLRRTTDWSYIADRTFGENWFLCGETLGFADPILSAGMTLTQTCARHCAYMILELERGEHDAHWLRSQYDEVQRRRVVQHMRFAEYWYSANGMFSDVRKNTSEIAKDSGLTLTAEEAFRWISHGGVDDEVGQVAIGGMNLAGIKQVQWRLDHTKDEAIRYLIDGKNVFKLSLTGAKETSVAHLHEGRIHRIKAYARNGRTLPVAGSYEVIINALNRHSDIDKILPFLKSEVTQRFGAADAQLAQNEAMQCLEMMAVNGWVTCSVKKGKPTLEMSTPKEGALIFSENANPAKPIKDNKPTRRG